MMADLVWRGYTLSQQSPTEWMYEGWGQDSNDGFVINVVYGGLKEADGVPPETHYSACISYQEEESDEGCPAFSGEGPTAELALEAALLRVRSFPRKFEALLMRRFPEK